MWIEFVLRGCMYGLGKFKMQITVNLQKDFKKNNFLKFQRINAGVVFFSLQRLCGGFGSHAPTVRVYVVKPHM